MPLEIDYFRRGRLGYDPWAASFEARSRDERRDRHTRREPTRVMCNAGVRRSETSSQRDVHHQALLQRGGDRRETRESREVPVLRVGLAAPRGTAALHLNDLKSQLRTFAVTGHVPGTDGCRRCAARSSVGERARLHTDEGKLWSTQRIQAARITPNCRNMHLAGNLACCAKTSGKTRRC